MLIIFLGKTYYILCQILLNSFWKMFSWINFTLKCIAVIKYVCGAFVINKHICKIIQVSTVVWYYLT